MTPPYRPLHRDGPPPAWTGEPVSFADYLEATRRAAAEGDEAAQDELDRWQRWGLLDRHPSRGEDR